MLAEGAPWGSTEKPHFHRDNNTLGILDPFHSDVSGRTSHVSLRGYEYYVIFIDDFSRKT